jgi:hypothetical protein
MTVVIPTYNNTAALQKAIESVYAQVRVWPARGLCMGERVGVAGEGS